MKFDALIIGTGQAGPSLAASLAKNGYNTAIIEKGNLGGSCVNVGCTPTKAYVASARRAYVAKNSTEHGVHIKGEIYVDLKEIKDRKDKIINDSRTGLEKMLTDTEGITLIKGEASMIDDHTIVVNNKKITADKLFLNVGTRPRIPDGFEDATYLTNETILELEEIPEHLIVIGGGYIGLEFGQMFRRFGSEVTIIEKGSHLLKKEDPDISEIILEIMKNSGIQVKLDSHCIEAKSEAESISLTFRCDSRTEKVIGSHLLLATGRVPNTDVLNVEKAGIEINSRGYINVSNTLQTNIDHIWALGDCNGEGAFTHTSYNDFQIVNSQLFEDKKRFLSDRIMCYAVYIDPPFARVGMNETDIVDTDIQAMVAEYAMSDIARAKEMGETTGKLKIFINAKSNKILGASFIGAGADEYIHSIIDLMYAGASYEVIRDAVHIHPTISELIPTMLESPKKLS